ncbi:hypothetical protein PPERSA_11194 [Pseudocohnilembus persalinus]|uniref:t-SNARE coiled-coil homology domain-containing protein n=1 Tax=Pseudocohnilembus persalinus TaxID=266149 RepID=A0A0V0R004_PSEPJ|nr:hypothetical protein PPERSA_11194 [Pseudocohnilembus persalinus]|eukprot:KRX07645.1 hypothetical protein PPERSA_11194 [Pseudocohnilembus persalinus]
MATIKQKFGQNFKLLTEASVKTRNNLVQLIQQREQQMKEGVSQAKQTQTIRRALIQYQKELLTLEQNLKMIGQQTLEFGLNTQEFDEYKNKIVQLSGEYIKIKEEFEGQSKFESRQNLAREQDNQYKQQAYNKYENQQEIELQELQQKMFEDQDKKIEQLFETTGRIKYQSKLMNTTLKEQNEKLKFMETQVDKNTVKIQKAQGKLEDLLKKTNTCCLWGVVIGQLFLFVFLVSL